MKFPVEFQEAWNRTDTKAAFVSEIKPMLPSECMNCGGLGFLATFVATEGPYKSPSPKHKEISHFDGEHWWVGETIAAECPVCKGPR